MFRWLTNPANLTNSPSIAGPNLANTKLCSHLSCLAWVRMVCQFQVSAMPFFNLFFFILQLTVGVSNRPMLIKKSALDPSETFDSRSKSALDWTHQKLDVTHQPWHNCWAGRAFRTQNWRSLGARRFFNFSTNLVLNSSKAARSVISGEPSSTYHGLRCRSDKTEVVATACW